MTSLTCHSQTRHFQTCHTKNMKPIFHLIVYHRKSFPLKAWKFTFFWFDSNDSLKLGGKYEFLKNLPLFFFLLCLKVSTFQVLILCIMYSLKIGISSAHDEMIGDGLVN